MTDYPRNDSVDELIAVNGIVALDDGSVIWSGATTRGSREIAASFALPIINGAIGRVDPDGRPLWVVPIEGEQDIPNMIAPDEETSYDIQLGADGAGIVFRGHFHENLIIGDMTTSAPDRNAYVARLDLDGDPIWLQTFGASEPIGLGMEAPGLAVTASGQLFTVGVFSDERSRLAEIDPDGELVALNEVAWPPPEFPAGSYLDGAVMTAAGDTILIAGSTCEGDPDAAAGPAFVAVHDAAGQLTSVRNLGVQPPVPGTAGRTRVIAASRDGRVAVGGLFEGAADFGAGPVESAPDLESQAFLAVYGPAASPVD